MPSKNDDVNVPVSYRVTIMVRMVLNTITCTTGGPPGYHIPTAGNNPNDGILEKSKMTGKGGSKALRISIGAD